MAPLHRALVLSLLVLTGAAVGCGSASTTVLSPSALAGRCGLTLDVSALSVSAAGGAGVVRIQTNRECAWAIPPQPSWVKLTRPATLQGPAEIAFVVDENRSTSLRSWELLVADQRAVISQEAASCTWSLSPSKLSIDASGGDAQVVLTTEEFCAWELPSPVSWIGVVPERGRGTAEITVRVSRNAGSARIGNVRVSSAAVEVTQREAPPAPGPVPPAPAPPAPVPPQPAPTPPSPTPPSVPEPPPPLPSPAPPPAPVCTFVVQPNRFSDVVATAVTLHVDVTTQAGCTWVSQSAVEWLRAAGDSRNGSARLEINVSANSGVARTAAIVVAGQNVTIEQRAVTCTFTVTPGSLTTAAAGGAVSVTVNSPPGCAWRVTGTPNWVTVSSSSGTGSGSFSIAVAPNTGAARTAVLMVAGREFRVEQTGLACTYAVTPDQFRLSQKKQNKKIQVDTPSHCQWSATTSAGWVHVRSGTTTGSGALEVKVEENSRSETRTAIVIVAGENFTKEVTITQDEDDD